MSGAEATAAAVVLVGAAALLAGRRLFAGDAARHHLDLLSGGGTAAGPLAEVAGAIKILGLFATALAVVLSPLGRLPLHALLILGLAAASRVRLAMLCDRFLDLLPFAVLAAVGMLAAGDVERFVAVLSRAALVQVALVVVVITTPLGEFLAGLRGLRVPPVLVGMTALTLRYLALLLDEGSRMGLAFSARAVGRRDLRLARPLGRVVGCLAVRSLERADRVHLAMCARGFDGELPLPPRARPVTAGQCLALSAWSLVVGLVAWWPA